MSPLPGTRVIDPDWSARNRPVTEGAMTATVTGRRPGGTEGPLDPETGQREIVPFPAHYTGGARIQVSPVFGGGETLAAGQEVTTVTYLVAVTLAGSTAWAIGDLVDVTAVDGNGDPTLVGRSLTVTGFARGSLAWERDLICTDDLG